MTSAQTHAALVRARRRLTRRAQRLVGVEATFLAVLAVLAGHRMLARDTTANTVLAAGFRLGPIPILAMLITAVALLATLRWSLVLGRVVLTKAVGYAVLFLAWGVHSPHGGPWALNATGALLLAGISIAAFAEYVLLNSASFDSEPGTTS